MPKELNESLLALNEELDKHPALSDSEREALSDLAAKIQEEVGGEISQDRPNELEVFVAQFEESHPDLSKVIKRVIDGLSGMGI